MWMRKEFNQQAPIFSLVSKTNSQSKLRLRSSVNLRNSDPTLLGSVRNHTCCFYSPDTKPHIHIFTVSCSFLLRKWFPSTLIFPSLSSFLLKNWRCPQLQDSDGSLKSVGWLSATKFSAAYQGLVKSSWTNIYWQTPGIQWRPSHIFFPFKGTLCIGGNKYANEPLSKWLKNV